MRDAAEEVGVERQDNVGVFELVLRVGVAAEGSLGRGAGRVLVERLPLDHLRLRIDLLHGLPLRRERVGEVMVSLRK